MEKLPTPRQMHHFVGEMFELAGAIQCVQKRPDQLGAGKYAWGMIFPTVFVDHSEFNGVEVDAYQSSCLRIGRLGFTAWSLTAYDDFDIVPVSPEFEPKIYIDQTGHVDKKATFDSLRVQSRRLKTVSRIVWDSKKVQSTSRKTMRIVNNVNDHYDHYVSRHSSPHSVLQRQQEQMSNIGSDDLEFMREQYRVTYAQYTRNNAI